MKLEGRVALITGGARGIGREIALGFAAEGARLVLNATSEKSLDQARAICAEKGAEVRGLACDVSDRAAVERMVQKAIEAFGQIDILVNNAGIHIGSAFVDYKPEDFDRVMRVNTYGPFNVSQFVLRHMIERGRGKVVNIASTAGKWPSRNQTAYNVSKHALVGMTRCIALELGEKNIQVNAICPGYVETEMMTQHGPLPEAVAATMKARVAMGRFIQPREIVPLAVYLASSDSDGMTGQSIVLDGGMVFV
jgi:meso-butanediol dehydrogenase / (S,S)-butanediol dehydrogenase / diacetyl reductase